MTYVRQAKAERMLWPGVFSDLYADIILVDAEALVGSAARSPSMSYEEPSTALRELTERIHAMRDSL